MIKTIFKKYATSLMFATVLVCSQVAMFTIPASAASGSKDAACEGAGLAGSDCGSGGGAAIGNVITAIVNVLSAIVGAVAVVMIIIAGFKYVTAGGDTNNISGAKSTLTYAIIGLVIVALAQIIVHFVIDKAGNAASGGTSAIILHHFSIL